MKKFRVRYKHNLVGTRCSASGLGFALADARQRVPTLNEFFHTFRGGGEQRAVPERRGGFFVVVPTEAFGLYPSEEGTF